jgi:hypothetical protein
MSGIRIMLSRHTKQEVCPWNVPFASAATEGWYNGLRRNVAIALWNWLSASDTPDPEAVRETAAARSDENRVVAEAAAWGFGQADRDP